MKILLTTELLVAGGPLVPAAVVDRVLQSAMAHAGGLKKNSINIANATTKMGGKL